jgi:uncharacterized phosphosugar-binding protein
MAEALNQNYLRTVTEMLGAIPGANLEALQRAAAAIGPSIAVGGVLHTFGSGHSEIIAREIVGRAGGLVCVTAIQDPTAGFVENLPGYGRRLAERHHRIHRMEPGEGVIVISNSGKNCSPIEVAMVARELGLTVIALTNMTMSRQTPSEHPSGKKLYEVADYVLDNGGVPGDAVVSLPDGSTKAGPTSTIAGALLLNLFQLHVIEWLAERGHPLPVLRSQNTPGGIEANRALGAKYRTRLSKPLA